MDKNKIQNLRQSRRHGRVRAKVSGTSERPRLSVFRSNRGMFLQLVDDDKGVTLVSAGFHEIKSAAKPEGGKVAVSEELGKLLAKKAKDKNITRVVFDRGAYKYHGRIQAAAEGARSGGLEF